MFAPRHRTDMMCPYPRSKERGLSGPRRGWFGGAGASADRAPGRRPLRVRGGQEPYVPGRDVALPRRTRLRAWLAHPPSSPLARRRAESWHTLTADGVVRRLETSIAAGLDVEEAGARLARFGDNRLPEPRPKSTLEIITGHVMSVPVLVLGVAATLSIASGAVIDAGVIIAVIGINAVVGYVTERRVERVLMSLQNATVPRALVRRENQDVLVPAASLVVGDVLVLRAGHEIAADARLVEEIEEHTS